jgi:hypothetical protein
MPWPVACQGLSTPSSRSEQSHDHTPKRVTKSYVFLLAHGCRKLQQSVINQSSKSYIYQAHTVHLKACQSHKPPKTVLSTNVRRASMCTQCWCFHSWYQSTVYASTIYAYASTIYAYVSTISADVSHIGGKRAEALVTGRPPMQHAVRQRRELEAR